MVKKVTNYLYVLVELQSEPEHVMLQSQFQQLIEQCVMPIFVRIYVKMERGF
jgi:hypothetical protein